MKNEPRHKKSAREYSDSERYINTMHRLGRLGMCGAILIMLGMPTVLGLRFHALPAAAQTIRAALPLLIIFVPSNLFEVISYTPILGSAIYLTLITGEVVNLKLPVVNNALKLTGAEPGSEEADVISSIAVSVAAFVTIGVVTVGVLLSIPLQPFLTTPAVKIVSVNILPALFGALSVNILGGDLGGGIRARGRLKGFVPSLLVILLLTGFDRQLSALLGLDRLIGQEGGGVIMSTFQGLVIILILPISYFFTKWLYKKRRIHVRLPSDPR
jgi:hypothetical protein